MKSQNQLEPEISTDRVNQASPVEMVDSDQNSSSSSYYNCDQNNEDFHFFLQHLELLWKVRNVKNTNLHVKNN